jgi:hypothetical protein
MICGTNPDEISRRSTFKEIDLQPSPGNGLIRIPAIWKACARGRRQLHPETVEGRAGIIALARRHEAVIIAAEDRAPILHARIGMLRALNHGKPSPARRYQGRAAIRARFGRLSISSPLGAL